MKVQFKDQVQDFQSDIAVSFSSSIEKKQLQSSTQSSFLDFFQKTHFSEFEKNEENVKETKNDDYNDYNNDPKIQQPSKEKESLTNNSIESKKLKDKDSDDSKEELKKSIKEEKDVKLELLLNLLTSPNFQKSNSLEKEKKDSTLETFSKVVIGPKKNNIKKNEIINYKFVEQKELNHNLNGKLSENLTKIKIKNQSLSERKIGKDKHSEKDLQFNKNISALEDQLVAKNQVQSQNNKIPTIVADVKESEKWEIKFQEKNHLFSKLNKKNESKIIQEIQKKESNSFLNDGNKNFESKESQFLLLNQDMKLARSETLLRLNESDQIANKSFKENLNEFIKTAKVNIIDQGKTSAEIHLNPKYLGKMSLKISVENSNVEGKIIVESEKVKQMVQAELKNIESELKVNGLNLEVLKVEVQTEGNNLFNFSTNDSHKKNNPFRDQNNDSNIYKIGNEMEESDLTTENITTGITNNRIDLKV